jgi:hypothetical protein
MTGNTELRKNIYSSLLFAFFLLWVSASAEGKGFGTMNCELDNFRWKSRLIMIFAPSSLSASYKDQIGPLVKEEGVTERDLIVIEVFEKGASQCNNQPISTESAQRLRRLYDVKDNQFQVILIGKDGGVKMRADEPVTPQHLFGLIDAMPMRQQEMRKKRNRPIR